MNWKVLPLLSVLALACNQEKKNSGDDDKSSKKTVQSASTAKETTKPAAAAPAAPAAGAPDFPAIFGTKADGREPKVFAGLKEDMTPAQAGAVLKGADKVSEHGFAEIVPENVPGVAKYELSFLDGKLAFGTIWFTKENDTPEFQKKLVEAAKAKWGEPQPVKPGEEMVMWIDDEMRSVTVSKIIDLDAKGWEIKFTF